MTGRMRILGITSFIHASGAALLADGEIMTATDEECFTWEKFTGNFPVRTIEFCLERAEIALSDKPRNARRPIPAEVWHHRPCAPHRMHIARGSYESWAAAFPG